MPPNDNERVDVIVTNQNGPGLWYFARHAILEYYGFNGNDETYQRKLVIWLRGNYKDMLKYPNANLTDLFFELNTKITIPSKIETVEIIGGFSICEMTYCGDVFLKPVITEIKLLDTDNNEIKDEWTVEKQLKITVHCENSYNDTNVKLIVYEKNNEEGFKRKDELITKSEETGIYTAEWEYIYNGEELVVKPKFYFEAYVEGVDSIHSNYIEISMEINIVVIDYNNVLIIDNGIENTTDPNRKTNNPVVIKFIRDNGAVYDEIKGKTDSKGEFKKSGLIPSWFTISVRTPMDRLYTDVKYSDNRNKQVHDLKQIDASEEIKYYKSESKYKIDRINIIRLDNICFLEAEDIDTIEKIIGNTYFEKEINLKGIQIFEGDPSLKHINDTLNHFSFLSIINNLTNKEIIDNINGRGMSLPNGIIYIPKNNKLISEKKALLVHEAFHQFQYVRYGKDVAFKKLVEEMEKQFITDGKYNPYDYLEHSKQGTISKIENIDNLDQITTFEGQANLIHHYSFHILKINITNLPAFIELKRILSHEKSGLKINE